MRKADPASTGIAPADLDAATAVARLPAVQLHGRPVRWEMTRAAQAAAARLAAPLIVEMELYFSCFVRKAVRFRVPVEGDDTASAAALSEHLRLRFRAVTTRHCAMPADAAEVPLETLPVTRPHAFVPRWLKLDHRDGLWCGEFGY